MKALKLLEGNEPKVVEVEFKGDSIAKALGADAVRGTWLPWTGPSDREWLVIVYYPAEPGKVPAIIKGHNTRPCLITVQGVNGSEVELGPRDVMALCTYVVAEEVGVKVPKSVMKVDSSAYAESVDTRIAAFKCVAKVDPFDDSYLAQMLLPELSAYDRVLAQQKIMYAVEDTEVHRVACMAVMKNDLLAFERLRKRVVDVPSHAATAAGL